MGLGLQIVRYIGISNRLISCVWCSRAPQKMGHKQHGVTVIVKIPFTVHSSWVGLWHAWNNMQKSTTVANFCNSVTRDWDVANPGIWEKRPTSWDYGSQDCIPLKLFSCVDTWGVAQYTGGRTSSIQRGQRSVQQLRHLMEPPGVWSSVPQPCRWNQNRWYKASWWLDFGKWDWAGLVV